MNIDDFKPERIYQRIIEAGDDWADKDAAATILEETKKTVHSEIFNGQPQGMAIGAREHAANADPAYKLHVINMVTARKEANKAKVRFDGAKLLADLRRSEESTRRAAMRAA